MVFDTSSPPASSSSTNRILSLNRMFKSPHASTGDLPLSDERDLSQIEAANKHQQQQQQQPSKWKMMSKRRQSCANDMYTTASRYHRSKPPLPPPTLNNLSTLDETLTSVSPSFYNYEKFHGKLYSDDMKYFSNQSALITTRRSTTDCNDLKNMHRRRLEQTNNTLLTIVDEESRDTIWLPSDDHHLLPPTSRSAHTPDTSLSMYYSDSSMNSSLLISSFNSNSNSNDLHETSSQYSSSTSLFNDSSETPKTDSLSSSSGYESNVTTLNSSISSLPDSLFLTSPDSIIMPPPPVPSPKLPNNSDRNLVEQFIDLHLQKQTSFYQDASYSPPSSLSSSSSSFLSQTPISTKHTPICCRKCVNNDEDKNQLSSDTEDDSQSTTIATNSLPSQQQQQQQNKRPRSLPIAIQQPKGITVDNNNNNNDDAAEGDDDDEYAEFDNSLQDSLTCHCSISSSRKKRFRTCEFNQQPIFNTAASANGLFSDNNQLTTATTTTTTTSDKLHIDLKDIDHKNNNEPSTIKQQKNSLDHFIMSPTDKVKVPMKYPSINNDKGSDIKSNELKISQPEDIDFKRSKQKAIRVLYQNRLNLNSIRTPVPRQTPKIFPLRTATCHGDSPLAKRTSNPRLLRSVLSCSAFETDDEHEVVSSTTIANQAGVNGAREKSYIETFNSLRGNFTESLLNGKILPCDILDGFTVKLGASGLFMPKQVVLPVTTFWFNVSEHQAASPYLGFINLQCLPKRGYHAPTKGTITLALLNPNGTAIHLFLILYDLSDMPPDHRTFIRQRIVLMPENAGDGTKKPEKTSSSKGNLRYLAHIRFVTSQTGKLYMHSDIRLIFARNKLDYDDRTAGGKAQLVTLTDIPTPKYWSRK
ncbi:unnamed protein product [Rotaria socialis]|uniref:Atos-like conserved domain-containing protein n=2 Tax=Rotaria socialis TaxID=392032 RepID=A0A817W1C5_9BILA|nr:unnamed protein product [Rotaria socialis]